MSKGSRYRESNAEKQRLKKEREQFEANKKKVRRVTAIITTSIILLIVLVTVVATISYNIRMNKGEYLRREIAAASQNIEVDGAMMNYYFNDIYNTFVDYYGSYVLYFGLDTMMPLRDQQFSDGESWFDYFMSGAKDSVTNILALNEAAAADGITLSEAEIAAMRSRTDEMDEGLYGRGVNQDDIYNAKLLEALAYKLQFDKEADFAPSASEITEYYENNSKKFQKVDFYLFPLYYSEDGMSEDEVKSYADELAAAENADDFKQIVEKILLVEDPDMTEDEINTALESIVVTGALYTEGSELLEWAFTANSGDTLIIPDTENTQYNVYMLTYEPYRDESTTVNVRHILLSDASYDDREDTLEAAQDLLEEFRAGDQSLETFALYALEYSDDAGSYYNGGRYENVTQGQMVEAFNDWCFDESRREGDTGIVETDYGCHIMYFEGASIKAWEASVSDAIVSERMTEYLTEITSEYSVVFDENVLDMIPD